MFPKTSHAVPCRRRNSQKAPGQRYNLNAKRRVVRIYEGEKLEAQHEKTAGYSRPGINEELEREMVFYEFNILQNCIFSLLNEPVLPLEQKKKTRTRILRSNLLISYQVLLRKKSANSLCASLRLARVTSYLK